MENIINIFDEINKIMTELPFLPVILVFLVLSISILILKNVLTSAEKAFYHICGYEIAEALVCVLPGIILASIVIYFMIKSL